MPYFKEVNTGQVVEVTGDRVARFERMARWVETSEKPATKKTTSDTKTEEPKKTTRRGGRRASSNK